MRKGIFFGGRENLVNSYGRREEILGRKEKQKRQSLPERFEYNRGRNNQETRLFTGPNTDNPSIATGATISGEPNA
jgi:hypothetical protein